MYPRTYYFIIVHQPLRNSLRPERISNLRHTHALVGGQKSLPLQPLSLSLATMTQETTIDYRLIFALMNGKISSALRKRLDAEFHAGNIAISCDQWDVLLAISSRDICTQQDLCDATSFSKPAMSRIIDSLVEMRIATRRKSRVDFRNNYITLTLSGIELVERAQAVATRTLKECLRGLSRQDILTSQQSLNTVLHNLRRKELELAQEHSEEQHREAEAHRKAVRRMYSARASRTKSSTKD